MQPSESSFSFDAIGTRWWCEDLDGHELSDAAKTSILLRAKEFNQSFTRFDDSSLVGQLNRGLTVTRPPAELLALFVYAKQLYDDSMGAFNISVGGELHRTGYGARSRAAPIWDNPWSDIQYDADQVSIPPTMTIDFGGIGKGWLIDSFADIMRSHGTDHFIINGGGDMLIRSDRPIEITLEHPLDDARFIGSTKISNGALAVSGNSRRQWQYNGETYHHLIDPIRKDSNPPAAVYVKAATATIADAMATILFLRPSLRQKLEKKYGLNVVVLDASRLKN